MRGELTQEQKGLIADLVKGRVHVVLDLPLECGAITEEAIAFDDAFRDAIRALLDAYEELKLRIECDLRDPAHKNCRNGEKQLEAAHDATIRALEAAESQLVEKEREIEGLRASEQTLEAALRGEQGIEFEDGTVVNVADLRQQLEAAQAQLAEFGKKNREYMARGGGIS